MVGAIGYKVYGRTGGGEQLLATRYAYDIHNKPYNGVVTSFVDDGSVTPSGALPARNSTGNFIVEGVGNFGMGAAVASASTITITGNAFHVTGTTGISAISSTNIIAGTEVTIFFDGAVTLTHGSTLKLSGSTSFTTTAGTRCKFVWDGTAWWETSRIQP
jgi:hypothetical protein